MILEKNWTTIKKTVKIENSLISYTKINSKWIKDLNERVDIIKVLGKDIIRTPSDKNHSNIFLPTSYLLNSVQFSCSVMSDSLKPHGLQHVRLP